MLAFLLSLTLFAAIRGVAALPNFALPLTGGWPQITSQLYSSGHYYAAAKTDDKKGDQYPDIVEANFTQRLDQLGEGSNVTFPQRYYFTLRHYKDPSKRPKGSPCPVYIFDGGELSGWERLNILDHGINDILAAETGGIGIVLENRFYGTSHPLRSELGPGVNWTTDQFEFFTYHQTLADTASFIEHLNITGVKEDLTAKTGNAAVIMYGGSYAGARVAHLRKLYPHLVYGAISSSGVVGSVVNNYGYYHPVARGNNATSMQALAAAVTAMDRIIAPEPEKGAKQTKRDGKKVDALLYLAGLKGLKDPLPLAYLVQGPLGYHQSNSWYRPHSQAFDDWLRSIGYTNETQVGRLRSQRKEAGLTEDDVPEELLRLLAVTREWYVDPCVNQKDSSAQKCFGIDEKPPPPVVDKLDNLWVWFWFTCTDVGFFQSATPVTASGSLAPGGPKIVSSLLDEAAASRYCRENYPVGPSGKHPIPERPNNKYWNSFGGFQIDAPRLALVNGQFDPWREVSIHSELYANGGTRGNSLERPTILIPEGIHHDDEYGVDPKYNQPMPYRVKVVQEQLIAAVKSWLANYKKDKPPADAPSVAPAPALAPAAAPARRQHAHPHHARRGEDRSLLR